MPRGSWKKRWIKLYVTGWLHGTIRWQLKAEERGVWADFLALAGEAQKDGAICDNDGRPLPLDFIANQLNIKRSLLDRFIAKAIDENMIRIDDTGVIHISNYMAYQSEYERQKPYRQADTPAYSEAEFSKDRAAIEDSLGCVITAYEEELQCGPYDPEIINYFTEKYGKKLGKKYTILFNGILNAINRG